jgi:hypothetical protein
MNLDIDDRPHIMLDIETWGAVPPHGKLAHPTPMQIAWVVFEINSNDITHGLRRSYLFHPTIAQNTETFDFDWRTVAFHIENGNANLIQRAIRDGIKSRRKAKNVIGRFRSGYADVDASGGSVWVSGAGFDVPILRNFALQVGADHVWDHHRIRDLRALAPLPSPEYTLRGDVRFEHGGKQHEAVSDCLHQIEQLAAKLSVSTDEYSGLSRMEAE